MGQIELILIKLGVPNTYDQIFVGSFIAHEAVVPAPINLRVAGRLIFVANSERSCAKLQAILTPRQHYVHLLTS